MFDLSPIHLILVLVIVLIIFGPGKLPDVSKAVGNALKSFKHAVNEPESKSENTPETPKNDKTET